MIFKTIKYLIVSFISLVIAALAIFLIAGYPNDSRIELDQKKISASIPETDFSPYTSGVDIKELYQFDLSMEDYLKLLNKQYHGIQSLKKINYFNYHPYLIRVATGAYPELIEENKTFLLTKDNKLTINQSFEGDLFVSFQYLSTSTESTIQIVQNGVEVQKIIPPSLPNIKDTKSWYYKNIDRYINVDQPEYNFSNWHKITIPLKLAKGDILKFTCQSESACFITPPIFYTKKLDTNKRKVLIVIDTLRFDAVNEEDMPFLNSIAKKSANFTKTFSAGNMTSPATNGLLSCQQPNKIGQIAFSYNPSNKEKEEFYSKNQPSFPFWFSWNNWSTAAIGNISVLSEVIGGGVDHGFSQQISIEQDGYDTPKITRAAINWLKQNSADPFFLYLHYHAPHAAYRPPLKDIISTYKSIEDLSSYPNILKWLYRGETYFTDRYLRKLFESMDEIGILENTEVIITSDHGEHQSEYKFISNEINYAKVGAFFDHGATLLNDEIHIPFIYYSNKVPLGNFTNLTSNLDAGPTLLSSAQIDIPEWCQGIPVQQFIFQEKFANSEINNRTLGAEGFNRRSIFFDGKYKYIKSYEPTHKILYSYNSYFGKNYDLFEIEQLFNIEKDYSEENNLLFTNPQLLNSAREKYNEFYNNEYIWVLAIKSPKNSQIEVNFQESMDFIEIPEQAQINKEKTKIRVEDVREVLIKLKSPWEKNPTITVDNQEISLLQTYSQINAGIEVSKLPIEALPDLKLNFVKSPIAFAVKTEAKSLNRKIQAGNAEFEEILREWGYLNDSK